MYYGHVYHVYACVLCLPWVCLYVSCSRMSCLCLHLSWMDVTVIFPECAPKGSSCHDTRIWTYMETNHHKLDISSFYIKKYIQHVWKCTRVKSISERPKEGSWNLIATWQLNISGKYKNYKERWISNILKYYTIYYITPYYNILCYIILYYVIILYVMILISRQLLTHILL